MDDNQVNSIDEFENGYLTYFNDENGIFIPRNSDTIMLYEKFGKEWDYATFHRNEIESIETITVKPSELSLYGNYGVGDAIRVGIENSIAKRSATSQTGIRVILKDIDLPPFFIQIADAKDRDVTKRALAQFIKSDMHGSFARLSPSIRSYFQARHKTEHFDTKEPSAETEAKGGAPWIAILFVIAFVGFIVFILIVD